MKVVIPLAGKGTRLRPHTHVTPKPLLRVGGQPVMSYILRDLDGLGVKEIVFITGFLKEKIEAYVRSEWPQFTAHFIEQPVQDGTAGAVRLAEDRIDDECLIIFVDTLFDADLSLVRRLPAGTAGVIWAKEVEDYQRFGVVVPDEHGHMVRIVEKPTIPEFGRLANIGLYYIRDWRLLFEGVRDTMRRPPGKGGEYYLTDAFQYMIDHGARIRIEEVAGWYDCGQLETLLETNRHLLENGRARAPDGGQAVRVVPPVRVEPGVTLENVSIGPNVTLGTGCVLRNSELHDCIVGERVVLDSVRLHDSMIGDDCEIVRVAGKISIGDHGMIDGNG
ncbi:MAG: NTP transferase domain-containing protein [Gemmatimonadetes bacterium]|nr:NTP transferase domain-containing protein [Gemmatimonadota bacterium]